MENQQPAALALADAIKFSGQFTNLHKLDAAADELRSLYARNQELEQCLESSEQKLVASLELLQLACAQGAEIQLRRLLKRIVELEDMLETVGAGGVSAQRLTQANQAVPVVLPEPVAAQTLFDRMIEAAKGKRADARDAERLDWLIGEGDAVVREGKTCFWVCWIDGENPDRDEDQAGEYPTARDAIDAAIAAAKENK